MGIYTDGKLFWYFMPLELIYIVQIHVPNFVANTGWPVIVHKLSFSQFLTALNKKINKDYFGFESNYTSTVYRHLIKNIVQYNSCLDKKKSERIQHGGLFRWVSLSSISYETVRLMDVPILELIANNF